MALALDILAIIKAASACGRIDDVARGFGCGLKGIVDGCPMDLGLALACQHHIHMVGSERRDNIGRLMHTTDVSQEGLIDAACQVETEVGILTETHVGKVLVRHGLNDGARHAGYTALRIVAIVEFSPLPLVVFLLDVVGDDGEQFVSQIAGSQTAAACAQDTIEKIGGADGEGARMRLTV